MNLFLNRKTLLPVICVLLQACGPALGIGVPVNLVTKGTLTGDEQRSANDTTKISSADQKKCFRNTKTEIDQDFDEISHQRAIVLAKFLDTQITTAQLSKNVLAQIKREDILQTHYNGSCVLADQSFYYVDLTPSLQITDDLKACAKLLTLNPVQNCVLPEKYSQYVHGLDRDHLIAMNRLPEIINETKDRLGIQFKVVESGGGGYVVSIDGQEKIDGARNRFADAFVKGTPEGTANELSDILSATSSLQADYEFVTPHLKMIPREYNAAIAKTQLLKNLHDNILYLFNAGSDKDRKTMPLWPTHPIVVKDGVVLKPIWD